MFYDHNGTKLEISIRKMSGNPPNVHNLSNTFKKLWANEESIKEVIKYFALSKKRKHNISNL